MIKTTLCHFFNTGGLKFSRKESRRPDLRYNRVSTRLKRSYCLMSNLLINTHSSRIIDNRDHITLLLINYDVIYRISERFMTSPSVFIACVYNEKTMKNRKFFHSYVKPIIKIQFVPKIVDSTNPRKFEKIHYFGSKL